MMRKQLKVKAYLIPALIDLVITVKGLAKLPSFLMKFKLCL